MYIPGTSHQLYACEDKRNVDNDTLTSQSLSVMDTLSQLCVDASMRDTESSIRKSH